MSFVSPFGRRRTDDRGPSFGGVHCPKSADTAGPEAASGRAGQGTRAAPRTELSYRRVGRLAEICRVRGCRPSPGSCPRYPPPSHASHLPRPSRLPVFPAVTAECGDGYRPHRPRKRSPSLLWQRRSHWRRSVPRVLTRRHVEVQPTRLRVALRPGLGIDATMRARRD